MTIHSTPPLPAKSGIAWSVTLVVSRLVALVAGCIFVACAAAILFEDVVLHGAAITLNHLLTLGVLLGALLVGHLLMDAWSERRWVAVGRFGILLAVATGLIVYLSTGKQAEHTFQSQAESDFAAEERKRINPLLTEAESMYSGTMKKLDADCVNGRKSKGHCDGLRTTLAVYEAAVKGHKADLAKYGVAKPVAPEAESFANIAAVFGFDKEKVKAGAILIVPFIRTILFELGGLWCLGFAFRPLPRTVSVLATVPEKPATREVSSQVAETVAERTPVSPAEQSDFSGLDIDEARKLGIGGKPGAGNWGNSGNGGPNGGKRVLSKAEALLDVTRRLASGETVDAQNELADAWGVVPSTVSKWMKRWRADGLVPAAQRVGRCHRLVAAE